MRLPIAGVISWPVSGMGTGSLCLAGPLIWRASHRTVLNYQFSYILPSRLGPLFTVSLGVASHSITLSGFGCLKAHPHQIWPLVLGVSACAHLERLWQVFT